MTTMEVGTKALGKVGIDPQEILKFSDGLYGFHEFHEFILLSGKEESVFRWLQSVEEPDLAFIIVKPETILKNAYAPGVVAADLEALQVKSVSECDVYLIVTIPENHPEKMTANLQGPVLIHKEKKIGRQVISTNDNHPVRLPILDQMGE